MKLQSTEPHLFCLSCLRLMLYWLIQFASSFGGPLNHISIVTFTKKMFNGHLIHPNFNHFLVTLSIKMMYYLLPFPWSYSTNFGCVVIFILLIYLIILSTHKNLTYVSIFFCCKTTGNSPSKGLFWLIILIGKPINSHQTQSNSVAEYHISEKPFPPYSVQ